MRAQEPLDNAFEEPLKYFGFFKLSAGLEGSRKFKE